MYIDAPNRAAYQIAADSPEPAAAATPGNPCPVAEKVIIIRGGDNADQNNLIANAEQV